MHAYMLSTYHEQARTPNISIRIDEKTHTYARVKRAKLLWQCGLQLCKCDVRAAQHF